MANRYAGPIYTLVMQPRPGNREIRFHPVTPREMGKPRRSGGKGAHAYV